MRFFSIEGRRTVLRGKLKPGGELSLTAQVEVPKEGTNLTLKLSLVQEGVAWFFTPGASTLDIAVKLEGDRTRAQTRD